MPSFVPNLKQIWFHHFGLWNPKNSKKKKMSLDMNINVVNMSKTIMPTTLFKFTSRIIIVWET